ncbi:MAG: glycosyltransferase family 2 protein [Candidatus Omnitrophica bacterium]|nr:glycosyltransferase family 2 protein [Candidatus Omnitrophota bacterium]HPP00213.1 glycosyltransferase family 2 protein [bacterium]
MSRPVSIVIPAYNEAESIGGVVENFRAVLRDHEHEILVVDDGSRDDTKSRAEAAGARVIRHHANRGYGASLKTGIRAAKHEWIALADADGQHQADDLLRLLAALDEGYDTVIGARDPHSFQYALRMPGKVFLQWFAGYLVAEKPRDVNSGFRVFRKEDALRYFPILPNGFSFTTTLTLGMLKDAYEVGWIPIQTQARQGRPSNVSLRDGFQTILLIIRIAMLFNPLKVFVPVSGFLFGIGFCYAVWNLFREWNIPDGAETMMTAGILIFVFGMLADQVASIRRGG